MRFSAVISFVLLLSLAVEVSGQRIRFPETPPPTSGYPGAGVPDGSYPGNAYPNFGYQGQPGIYPPGSAPPPGAILGSPNLGYDPFAPTMQGPMIQSGPAPGFGTPFGAPSPYQPYQPYQPYPPYPGASPYGMNSGPPQGIFGSDPYSSPYFRSSQDFLNNFEQGRYLRVVQEFHYRHTWLEGSVANEVDIHDSEIGFTLNWPNFLGSGEPFRVSPTFIFHFWDGPQPPAIGDLPSRAYSAFLAGSWTTPTNQNFGGEVVSSVGVYTDFNSFTSRSLRVKGTGLGWVRLTPNLLLKAGVSYLNRLDVKILPVGGLYWKASDRVELELYFPNPKIKYALQQIGNTELTAYLTADYGGDSWTISRVGGFSDQIDLIDMRVLGGIEFVGFRGLRGFFEAGYAFERELLYRITPASSLKLSDSVILRAGFLF